MPITSQLRLFATLVPGCLFCMSHFQAMEDSESNWLTDILQPCCNGYSKSCSTIQSSDSSEQYWPGWCHLCGIWMAGAPSSVQWSLGGEPLVAPLLSGPRWCSTTKKQQRLCTQNKGGLGGGWCHISNIYIGRLIYKQFNVIKIFFMIYFSIFECV